MNSSKINNTATVMCFGLKDLKGFYVSEYLITTALLTILSSVAACIVAMVGNALTLYSIWKASLLSNPSYMIIACLAITDFLSSITILPFNIVIRFQDMFNVHSCILKRIFSTVATILIGWSMLTTCIINLDCFLSLYFPFRFKTWNLNTWYLVAIVSSWSLWLLYSLLGASSILSLRTFISIQVSTIIGCLAIILTCQILIYRLIKARQTRIGVLAPNQSTATQVIDGVVQRNQRKSRMTIFIITAAFLICFFPRCAVIVAFSAARSPSFTLVYQGSRFSETILFANSAINPIIYSFRLPKIGKRVLALLRRSFSWFARPSRSESS
ncbi:melanocyte-stimulating hormone receptor-like [Rhopilema esculentum]|uniref:melanocyte-stimulating hormone receptor-like n=1 Tax=Rhopilema esculentum TaxID=499914 RepID=UPI0031DC4BA2|eukprot:gene2395-18039_t